MFSEEYDDAAHWQPVVTLPYQQVEVKAKWTLLISVPLNPMRTFTNPEEMGMLYLVELPINGYSFLCTDKCKAFLEILADLKSAMLQNTHTVLFALDQHFISLVSLSPPPPH